MAKAYKLLDLEESVLSNYRTLNQLEEHFAGKVSKETLEAILFPHKTKEGVIYMENENNPLIPHYDINKVNDILIMHGIDVKEKPFMETSSNIFSPSIFINTDEGKKRVRRDEFVIEDEGKKYAKAIHWAKEIPFNKARFSILLKNLESEEPEKYKKFVKNIEGTKTQTRQIYFSEEGMQYLVDVEPHIHLEDSSIKIPSKTNKEEYQSAYFWKENLFNKSSDRNYALSESKFFYQFLEKMPSYVKMLDGLKFRAYHKNDAIEAKTKTDELLKV